MSTADTDRDWNHLATQDPYYAVWTDERFRSQRLDETARRAFFASGEEHVEDILAIIRRRLLPDFAPRRALDFGCGVGRVTLPLARRCDEVVGVDVADAMLRLAEENCRYSGAANVRLVRGDDHLSGVTGTFDLIHSHIVFQHIPVQRGLALLDRLLERLAEGGVGVLHFTSDGLAARQQRDRAHPWRAVGRRLLGPAVGLYRLLRRLTAAPDMQMHEYPLEEVFRRLFEVGARAAWTEATDHHGYRGLILFFRKEDTASWRPCR
jgi:SAM-dependent methyltransferase